MRTLAITCVVLVLTLGAHAAPSFDCSKAARAAENAICNAPELQWFDRQLARLYSLALSEAGAARNMRLVEQRQFLARRDSCGVKYDCLVSAYETRLAELGHRVNVYEAYGKYTRESHGVMWVVRFGYGAGLNILTVGDNGHTCTFETDNATVGGKGTIRWRDNACRIDIVPDGQGLRVETHNCQKYCGMRAVMDGTYSRTK